MKKTLRLIALFLLVSQVLVSCGEGEKPDTTDADTSTDGESTTSVETSILDSLPERDYGGAEYTILAACEEVITKICSEEITGERLSDAIYKRNKDIEDMYSIKFNHDIVNGYMAGMNEVHKRLTGSVLAGDTTYDLFVQNSAYVSSLILEGLFSDLNSNQTLDFDGEWWHKLSNDSMMINNKLFIASGYYGIPTLTESWCMLLNKELLDNHGLDSPYKAVSDGTWTFDMMMDMAKTTIVDLNGDSKFDENDRYGLIMTDKEGFIGFSYGMGRLVTKNDENGVPKLTDADERTLNIMEKLSKLVGNKDHIMFSAEIQPDKEMIPMFNNKQALFGMYTMRIVEFQEMREASDFGILPMPKYDEKQENYITQAYHYISAIPALVKDTDMSSVILEALNRLSFRDVYPIYKEIILQRKLTRDNESAEIVDLISRNAVCDFGTVFFINVENKLIWPQDVCSKYASWWASNKEKLTAKLDGIIETIQGIGQ